MKPLFFSLLMIAALAAAPGKRRFTGTITDSICATADHSRMKMGATDAECTIACIDAHGAQYVQIDTVELHSGRSFVRLAGSDEVDHCYSRTPVTPLPIFDMVPSEVQQC
jgi:hypothetical protein